MVLNLNMNLTLKEKVLTALTSTIIFTLIILTFFLGDFLVVKEKLRIHLIPHSHTDLGWIKTVDDYFYGNRTDLHYGSVN